MESKQDKSVKPKGWGARHTLTLLGFLAFALSYAMRFNLAMAIVAMVKSPNVSTAKLSISQQQCPNLLAKSSRVSRLVFDLNITTTASSPLANSTVIYAGETEENDDEADWAADGEFEWDEEEQGVILGCFFFGYLVTQIPGGILGQKFGGKWPLGIGLLVTALFTLLTPVAAHLGKEALIAVRIVQGLGEGVTMPSMHGLLSKWVPIQERGMLSAAVYAGMNLGTAATMLISGYIIHYFGWPAVFYATGGCTLIWFVLWSWLVSNEPSDHPSISVEEREYILESLKSSGSEGKQSLSDVPWKALLFSGPFWAVFVCQSLETWGLYTLLHEIPTYMQNILHFDMKENCIFSAVPHLMAWLTAIIVTQIGDRLIEMKVVSVVAVRKACNTIGLWGAAVALVGVAYAGCDRTATPALLTTAVGCYGAILGGVVINLIDIAPNYASFLLGIINTVATLSGFIAPWFAGYVLKGNATIERWRIVFLVAAGICFFANLVYIIWASGEKQKWNEKQAPVKDSEEVALSWVADNPRNLGNAATQANVDFRRVVDMSRTG